MSLSWSIFGLTSWLSKSDADSLGTLGVVAATTSVGTGALTLSSARTKAMPGRERDTERESEAKAAAHCRRRVDDGDGVEAVGEADKDEGEDENENKDEDERHGGEMANRCEVTLRRPSAD